MNKRIAYCADGTWDSAANHTNVYRLWKAIVDIPGEQLAFYDDGVGCDGTPLEKLAGGVCGAGLFQKIKDGYSKISSVYEEGDEIFVFGFSRGAYTARSLAGMIAACGLPTKNPDPHLVSTAFDAYRDRQNRVAILAPLKTGYDLVKSTIRMVGVWDTVGSLGIPSIVGGVDPVIYGFLDTSLDPQILNAFHAVSIDERRAEFPATLWTSKPVNGQTLTQVYFSGVHCDVGGGYADDAGTRTALSDITFGWIMRNASKLGLVFDPAVLAASLLSMEKKTALDKLHDSWNPFWLFPKARDIAPDATLANSVTIRCQEDNSYRPRNLSFANGGPGPGYGTETVVN
jgi:uncharacterized protein (DUF2235 family)